MRENSSRDDRYAAHKTYEKTVRKAKEKFFQSKLEKICTPKEVFKATKWYKSTGSYRSSPLQDLRSPESPRAYILSEKMEVLAKNLLTNPSNMGDIPMDSLAVPSTLLPLPSPSIDEVQDAILCTGNNAQELMSYLLSFFDTHGRSLKS